MTDAPTATEVQEEISRRHQALIERRKTLAVRKAELERDEKMLAREMRDCIGAARMFGMTLDGMAIDSEGRRSSRSSDLIKAATQIIIDRGPITIADLLRSVEAGGLVVGGEKPRSNLAGFLSRASQKDANIQYTDGVGWHMKEMRNGTP